MYDFLFLLGLIGGWIVLNAWILPWFEIPTCLSGACRVQQVERSDSASTTRDEP